MARTLFAVVAGAAVMVISVTVIQMIGLQIFPTPTVSEPNTLPSGASSISLTSVGAQISVLLSWAFGAFSGAYTAANLSRQHKLESAIIIGLLMLIASAIMLYIIAQPIWMVVSALIAPIPMALIGWKFCIRTKSTA